MPCLSTPDEKLGTEPLLSVRGIQPTVSAAPVCVISPTTSALSSTRQQLDGAPRSGDEEIGLTDEQLAVARIEALADTELRGRFPRALRRNRSARQGLLLLYPISPASRPRADTQNRLPLFDDPECEGVTGGWDCACVPKQ